MERSLFFLRLRVMSAHFFGLPGCIVSFLEAHVELLG